MQMLCTIILRKFKQFSNRFPDSVERNALEERTHKNAVRSNLKLRSGFLRILWELGSERSQADS